MALSDLFTRKEVAGKPIYIVDDHHKALAAWAIERRKLETAPNLLTIDHHTDVIEAFHGHGCVEEYENEAVDGLALEKELVEKINFGSDESLIESICLLQHDEHIHAATMSGVLGSAFCIQLSDGGGSPSNEELAYDQLRSANYKAGIPTGPPPQRPMTYTATTERIYVVPHDCAIGCVKRPYDDECLVHHADDILESPYLEDQLSRIAEMTTSLGEELIEDKPYILDIDLDVFHTMKAINPKDASVFHRLIRNALAITIATEEECVQEEWLDDQNQVTAQDLLSRVIAHIEFALTSADGAETIPKGLS